MRLQVIDKNGIEYGGRRYAEGEEFDTEDTSRGRAWAAAFVAQRKARKFEPVLVGTPTPPPAPKPAAPVGTPPVSTAPEPVQKSEPEPEVEPSAPPPAFQPDEDATDSEASDDEPETADRPRRGRPPIHGRYSRRDVRPEE